MFDVDIHELRIALKQKKMKAVQKAFPIAGLPESDKLAARAENENTHYFSTYLTE
jgi:hypothetical protein